MSTPIHHLTHSGRQPATCRRALAVFAGAAALLASSALAGDMSEPQTMWQHMLERFDSDGDGSVSRAEVASIAKVARFDADGDGAVDKREFLSAASGMDFPPPLMKRRAPPAALDKVRARFFERLDRDGDGALSEAEMLAPALRRFDRIDGDGDGFITLAEVKGHREARKAAGRRRFALADRDDSGGLSLAEFRAMGKMRPHRERRGKPPSWLAKKRDPAAKFRKLDLNGDGELTMEELIESRKARKRFTSGR